MNNYCSNCGEAIKIKSNYCSNCGKRVILVKDLNNPKTSITNSKTTLPLTKDAFVPNIKNSESFYDLATNLKYRNDGSLYDFDHPIRLQEYYSKLREEDKLLKSKPFRLNLTKTGYEIFVDTFLNFQLFFIDYRDSILIINEGYFQIIDKKSDIKFNFFQGEKNFEKIWNCLTENSEIEPLNLNNKSIRHDIESVNNIRVNKVNENSDIKLSVPFIHYILLPVNVFFPWSIVSWIGIPLSVYAKNQLNNLSKTNQNAYKNEVLWTNITLGVFVFYLILSVLRALTIL